jgi:hypothetical protein
MLTKKGNKERASQSLGSTMSNYPVLLAKNRLLGKSHPLQGICAPLRGTPPSRFSALCGVYAPFFGVLLGCVKWLIIESIIH